MTSDAGDLLTRLAEHRMLSGFPRAELEWLAARGRLLPFQPGDFLPQQGNALFQVAFPTVIPTGQVVSATATAPDNSTSELSFSLPVADKPTVALSPADDSGVKGDNTTNVVRPHMIGTAAPLFVIDLFVNGASVATTTAGASGQYFPRMLYGQWGTLQQLREALGYGDFRCLICSVPGYRGPKSAVA